MRGSALHWNVEERGTGAGPNDLIKEHGLCPVPRVKYPLVTNRPTAARLRPANGNADKSVVNFLVGTPCFRDAASHQPWSSGNQ